MQSKGMSDDESINAQKLMARIGLLALHVMWRACICIVIYDVYSVDALELWTTEPIGRLPSHLQGEMAHV